MYEIEFTSHLVHSMPKKRTNNNLTPVCWLSKLVSNELCAILITKVYKNPVISIGRYNPPNE